MENKEGVRKSLTNVKEKLDNLEQDNSPKSFFSIKKDLDYIKDEIKNLSQKVESLNKPEEKRSSIEIKEISAEHKTLKSTWNKIIDFLEGDKK